MAEKACQIRLTSPGSTDHKILRELKWFILRESELILHLGGKHLKSVY